MEEINKSNETVEQEEQVSTPCTVEETAEVTEEAAAAPVAVAEKQEQPADVAPAKGSKYEQISTLGFVGILLLLAIPVVGPILVIVWACGGCRKLQKRRFARAQLIVAALSLLLTALLVFAAVRAVSNAIDELLDQFGLESVEEAVGMMESITSGDLSGETGKMVGSLVSDYITEGMDLSTEEQEQMNELIGAVISGETPAGEGTEELVGKVEGFRIEDVQIKNPNNPAQLRDAKLIVFER